VATVTLRPDGGTLGTGWSLVSGASIQACTNDNSDASYVFGDDDTGVCTVTFGTYSFPALARLTSVTPRYRLKHMATPTQFYHAFYARIVGESFPFPGYPDKIVGTTTMTTYNGSSRSLNPGGGIWVQADIDNISLAFTTSPTSSWIDTQVAELYLDVVYNEAPVTSAVSATAATSRPTIGWTYTDPEGDTQERAKVKIFTSSQATPDTPSVAPVYDVELLQSTTTNLVTVDLVNGTAYWAYVKTADVGSSGRYGNWSTAHNWTVTLTPPPTPTLTATAQNATARYELVATHGTFAAATQYFVIQRSLDAGATWTTIRSANEAPATAGSVLTTWDYEVPRGVAPKYRVQTVATPGTGRVSSAWSATQSPVALVLTGWWLKDPLSPSLNIQVTVASFSFRRKEPQSVYEPLGRSEALVVSDGVRGIDGNLELWAKTAAVYNAVEALLLTGHSLWLEDVLGRRWYVKFGDATDWSLIRATPAAGETTAIRHLHAVSLPFTQVAVPTGVPTIVPPPTVNTLSLPATSGNYASTPDTAANSPFATLDIRVKVSLTDWTPAANMALMAKWTASAAFIFRVNSAGVLAFLYSTDGSGVAGNLLSTAAVGATDGTVKWVRVTRDTGPQEVKFYTSDDGSAWTQLGTTVAGGALGIFNSTGAIEVGSWGGGVNDLLGGKVYTAELRTAIGGALVNVFDATAVTKLGTRNPTTVVSSTGETWTVNGSAWDWEAV
jgi:hypothetical protein